MSNRLFQGSRPADVASAFGAEDQTQGLVRPNWNIAPREIVGVLWQRINGPLALVPRRLGIVVGRKPGGGPIEAATAHAEKLGRTAEFKLAFRIGRCGLPIQGFYEWVGGPGASTCKARVPYAVAPQDGSMLMVPAICDYEDGGRGDDIQRVALLTLPCADPKAAPSGRLPAILDHASLPLWLDRRPAELDDLRSILRVPEGRLLRRWRVGRRVNDPSNQGPEVLTPEGEA